MPTLLILAAEKRTVERWREGRQGLAAAQCAVKAEQGAMNGYDCYERDGRCRYRYC